MPTLLRTLSLISVLALAGCDGDTAPDDAGTDGGDTTRDGGPVEDAGSSDGGTTDDGGSGDDASADDAGATEDAGATDDGGAADGGSGDAGSSACAGMECPDYATAIGDAVRGASSVDNCVVQLHQLDCCGAMAAYGINHASRAALCAAEAACVATYPADPGCTDATITTDSGETTTTMDDVKLRLAGGTCETFVCTTGACRSAPGISVGCG